MMISGTPSYVVVVVVVSPDIMIKVISGNSFI